MNKIKKIIFNLIRRFFWNDYDPNEEFSCGCCGKEMFYRHLFCSQKRQDDFENGKGRNIEGWE